MTCIRGVLFPWLLLALFVSACASSSTDDASTDASLDASDATTVDGGDCEDDDRDGDGIASVACGGADCDDDDANRFPGNPEVCDLDHVDEDCDPSTLGATDVDGDEFVDAACCNPDGSGDLVCGDDCNDLRPDVNPSATEACDQTDNNCDGRLDEGFDPSTCWPPCAPGTIQTAPPSALNPPTCDECAPGAYCPGGLAPRQPCVTSDWDHDADAGTVCVSRASCVAGQFVMSEGDATQNRTCATCALGSYSTTPNATLCMPWSVSCAAGQYVSIVPTSTNERGCQMCAVGQYSTSPNAAECTVWRDCPAGQSAGMPNATTDRTCVECEMGTFSANPNTPSCSAHTVCAAGQLETTAPNATEDRECASLATALRWSRQFGMGGGSTTVSDIAVFDDAIYLVDTRPTPSDNNDVFLYKFDADGLVVWISQFGTSQNDGATGVAVDSLGSVFVTGWTSGTLPGEASQGSLDAFIRKHDSDGNVLWTRQFGTSLSDASHAITVVDDHVIVTGRTRGAFPTYSLLGAADAFIAEYDSSGTQLWLRQFGAAPGAEVSPIAVGADGGGAIFLSGTVGGAFPGQTSSGGTDVFLSKRDLDGNLVWTRQFGTSATDQAAEHALAFTASGEIVLAGHTDGTLPSQTSTGGRDVFLRAHDTDGDVMWTRQFGTSGTDYAGALTVPGDGYIYLAGSVLGALTGHTALGGDDAFVARLSTTGALVGVRQFGTDQNDFVRGMAFVGSDLLLAGRTGGAFPGQTAPSSGAYASYLIRMSPW